MLSPDDLRVFAGTGVRAVFRGNGHGRVLAFRSDIDALPVTEETGCAYASQHPGYMHACGKTEQGIRMTVFDSYDEDALQLDIWTDQQCVPNFAEILWKGKRILSLKIDNFLIL